MYKMNIVAIPTIPDHKDLVNTRQQYKVLYDWAKEQSRYMSAKSYNSVPPIEMYFGGLKHNYVNKKN